MELESEDTVANRRSVPRYWATGQCIVHTIDGPITGRLRDISAAGAFIETRHSVPTGIDVTMEHPAAGALEGRVVRRTGDGISLSFQLSDETIAFALKVIAAEIAVQREQPPGSATPLIDA